MLPICPWARRFIHTKKPTSNMIGSRTGMSETKKLVCGVTNLVSGTESFMSCTSSSGMVRGAVDEKSLPSLRAPVILDESLLTRILVIWLFWTRCMKSG